MRYIIGMINYIIEMFFGGKTLMCTDKKTLFVIDKYLKGTTSDKHILSMCTHVTNVVQYYII